MPKRIKAAALLVGAAASAAGFASASVGPTLATPSATVHAVVNHTGELTVDPVGRPFVLAPQLRPTTPDRAVTGSFRARNQTSVPLAVRVRVGVPTAWFDQRLRLRVEHDGRAVYAGWLGGLRRQWTQRSFPIAVGEAAKVEVRVWIPETGRADFGGRVAELSVLLRSTVRR